MNWKNILGVVLGVVLVLGAIALWNPNADASPTGESVWDVSRFIKYGDCYDSDSGEKDHKYVKGETKGYVQETGQYIKHVDYCGVIEKSQIVKVDSCSGENCFLKEAGCMGNAEGSWYGGAGSFDCPFGCADGACIEKESGCVFLGNDHLTTDPVKYYGMTLNEVCEEQDLKCTAAQVTRIIYNASLKGFDPIMENAMKNTFLSSKALFCDKSFGSAEDVLIENGDWKGFTDRQEFGEVLCC